MCSRLAVRRVRHLSTSAAAAAVSSTASSKNSTITTSRAKSQLKYVYDPDKALEIYSSVSPHYTSPLSSRYTQAYTVRRLAKSHRFSDIENFLESHKKDPKITQEPFLSSLIRSYGIAGMFDHAINTYNQMDDLGTPRSDVSFNALLAACISSKHFGKAPELFDDLPKRYGFLPNKYSYGNLIKAHCEMGSPESAMERLKEMEDKCIEISAVIYTTMMNAFYKKWRNEEADKLWNEIGTSGRPLDVAEYNVRIMNIYGGDPEAVKVYEDLEGNFCKPNAATFRTLTFHLCKKQRFETG